MNPAYDQFGFLNLTDTGLKQTVRIKMKKKKEREEI